MKPTGMLLNRYRIEGEGSHHGLYDIEGLKIQTYRAFDTYRHEPVTVRLFPLPEAPELAALARSMWDREMRTAFIATASRKSDCLLRVVDSRAMPRDRHLILVTQQAGQSLREAFESGSPPRIVARPQRFQLWAEIGRLLESIQALHGAGLLHRNISLDSIYLSTEQDGPVFRLGDYSWTVYLHNLSNYLRRGGPSRLRSPDFWVYRAPELRSEGQRGESFATDLFAIGVVAAALISPLVREALLRDAPPGRELDVGAVLESDPDLDEIERLFFQGILAASPSNRFENALRAAESLQQILRRYQANAGREIQAQLLVSFDVRPETPAGARNLEGLARWQDTEGIVPRIEQFLEEDLTGAEVFVSEPLRRNDVEISRLFVRGNRGQPYSAIPYWKYQENRPNLDVANLMALKFEPVNVSEEPIAVLAGGVRMTPYGWQDSPTGHGWGEMFAEAKKATAPSEPAGPGDQFMENLYVILEAEESLLARQMLPVLITQTKGSPEGTAGILAEVAPRPDARHPDYPNQSTQTIEQWYASLLKERDVTAYLTEDASVSEFPEEGTTVKVVGLTKNGNLELELLPQATASRGAQAWLKPGSVKSTIVSMQRKRRAIRSIRPDDYLVQALAKTEPNTLFIDAQIDGALWDKILHTRPLFLVQGPPGTGKTYTATNVVTTALQQGIYNRILVVSQAHKPLDHLLTSIRSSLATAGIDPFPVAVRLARREETDWGHISTTDADLSLLAGQTLAKARKWNPKNPSLQDVHEQWLSLVDQEIGNPAPAWSDLILRSANVVFTTAMSRSLRTLEEHPPFDLVVVEEAAKAYATELIASLRLGRNWLLIGDQMQLPPYMFDEMREAALRCLSNDRAYEGLGEEELAILKARLIRAIRFFASLHESMTEAKYPFMPSGATKPAVMLTEQRRLPPELSDLISTVFYDQPFLMETPTRTPVIRDPTALAQSRLTWVDCPPPSATHEFRERRVAGGGYVNPGETNLIVKMLKRCTLTSGSVAIISPYAAQARSIADALERSPTQGGRITASDAHTVDSFQGREADLVLVSMVRNNDLENPANALGFLRAPERMNVLLSRARSQLVVVGSLRLFGAFDDPNLAFLKKIEAFMRERATVLTPNTTGVN